MDFWSIANYDLGLKTWEEFCELTPGMFHALCKRRNIRLKYERLSGAQAAAAVYNGHRNSESDPVVSAYDFIRDEASTRRRERLQQARQYVRKCLTVPASTSPEKRLEIRNKVIADLVTAGYPDAEAIVNNCFAKLN